MDELASLKHGFSVEMGEIHDDTVWLIEAPTVISYVGTMWSYKVCSMTKSQNGRPYADE